MAIVYRNMEETVDLTKHCWGSCSLLVCNRSQLNMFKSSQEGSTRQGEGKYTRQKVPLNAGGLGSEVRCVMWEVNMFLSDVLQRQSHLLRDAEI